MVNLALLIACLACTGYTRRVRSPIKHAHSTPHVVAQEPLKSIARGPDLHSHTTAKQPKVEIGAESAGTLNLWRGLAMIFVVFNTVALLRAHIRRTRGAASTMCPSHECGDKQKLDPSANKAAIKRNETHFAALSALPIINMWKQLVKSECAAPAGCDDEIRKEKFESKMTETLNILNEMVRNIKRLEPYQMLALATKAAGSETQSAANILAMAMASNHSQRDDTGKLAEIARKHGFKEVFTQNGEKQTCKDMPVMVIGEIVAKPTTDRMSGAGKELLLQIVRHATALGRLVVLSPASEWLLEYYQDIGFEPIDSADRVGPMVYSKPPADVIGSEGMLEMINLRLA